jgi:hypothetical protein
MRGVFFIIPSAVAPPSSVLKEISDRQPIALILMIFPIEIPRLM